MDHKQHVTTLADALQTECRRVARWAVAAFVLAVAASVLAAVTKSFVFVGVALFAWFFAWNRWKLRGFFGAFLPPPSENAQGWFEDAVKGLQRPPAWYRYSECIAVATFFAVAALVTIVVMLTSGTWMRLLYAVVWALAVVILVLKVRIARRNHTKNQPE